MRLKSLVPLLLLVSTPLSLAQGGLGAAQQGGNQGRLNAEARSINGQISTYLNGEEIKNILTPGEYSEWKLKLKAGQVVISEARSDAFDPAIEITDSSDKVMGSNDDRYPGDQRPLLLWRCEKDGEYSLKVRCFHDKAGGEFFLRYNVFDTLDLKPGTMSEANFDKQVNLLFRIPMKAGEIIQEISDRPTNDYAYSNWTTVISPTGLPDINLSRSLDEALPNTIMAPVDGDYYVLEGPLGPHSKIKVGVRDVPDETLSPKDGASTGSAKAGVGALWTVSVKKGQFLEFATPALNLNANIVLAVAPDISKYDVSKPETNPFFPIGQVKQTETDPGEIYPARARDPRVLVLSVGRDETLWVATNGSGPAGKPFELTVKPAAQPLENASKSKLRIGNTDYWSFNATVGDAMTFKTSAADFWEQVSVIDPDMSNIASKGADPDQNSLEWNLTAVKSGRYIVAVSSMGDGGGGEYLVDRKVTPPREFGIGHQASGEMVKDGELQVWKLNVKPNEPLLLHWTSSNWNYPVSVQDNNGREFNLHLTEVDGNTKFGIVKVGEPTSVLIVLTRRGNAKYSIYVSALPGYSKSK
jgi:hypothetical protein